MIERLACPFEGCPWTFVQDDEWREQFISGAFSPVGAAQAAADDLNARCKEHLDSEHPGWTWERVELESMIKRAKGLFHVGPQEMFP